MTAPGHARARPAIPWDGLLEVLTSYSGKGQLYQAVAAASGTDAWTAADVRSRARRVLFSAALPALAHWPDRPAPTSPCFCRR